METNRQKPPKSKFDPTEMLSVHARERWDKSRKNGVNFKDFMKSEVER